MSVDERLRRGLAANTAHLEPDLDLKLGALLGRAQRRRRARQSVFGLIAAAAAVGGVLWFSSPVDHDRVTLTPAAPAPHRSGTVASPTPLETVAGALPPGRYAAKFPRSAADVRAVLEVPDGFTTDGVSLFLADDDGNPTGSGAVGFWTVAEVHTDPCHSSGFSGAYLDPGPSVQDLATALARQPLRASTGDPVPVSLGGYDGLHLELAVPADLDVTDCIQDKVERWRFDQADRRWQEASGEVDRVWIIDVEGQRVVIGAAHTPSASKTDIARLTRVVESTTFSNTHRR